MNSYSTLAILLLAFFGVVTSQSSCDHGALRLADGPTPNQGRVEICIYQNWGSICGLENIGWRSPEANVACRSLGFDYGVALTRYGGGSGAVYSFTCTGQETSLLHCDSALWNVIGICSHDNDAGVTCHNNVEVKECNDGDVKFKNGASASRGEVEFCHEGRWMSVCNNGWGISETRAVCHQLKFDPKDASVIDIKEDSSESGPTLYVQATCDRHEQYFNECKHSAISKDSCSVAAGISCLQSSNQSRCKENTEGLAGSPNLPTITNTYGECSVYKSKATICEDVVRLGIDHVYARSSLGNQSTIASLLNDIAIDIETLTAGDDEDCVNQVHKLLCNYYLPPCGNATHPVAPSSICQEDCLIVQDKCQRTWNYVQFALKTLHPVINCNDTSKLLFPVPHCCTRIDLGRYSKGESPGGSGGSVADVVSGVLVSVISVVLIVAGIVVVGIVLHKNHRRKQLKRMQHDILPVPAKDTTQSMATVTERTDVALQEALVGTNTYDHALVTNTAESHEIRARVSSCYMRELTKGRVVVKKNSLNLLDCIGEGEFGIVYRAVLTKSNREVAVKTLKGNFDRIEVNKFVEESLMMSRFKHAHVMGLIGVCLDAGSAPYIIMPFMANGSLLKYLRKERSNIVLHQENDDDEVEEVQKRLMVMCLQIASGMEYLADEKYIHRDLAARNCMIDENFLIKITDFGLSEDVFERNYFRQESSFGDRVKLPVKWMAPESLSDGHFSEKSDVWSYGVTMWEIFSGGKSPYPGTDPLTLMQSLEQGHHMAQPYNTACNDEIYGMMMDCWKMSPEERPTFKDICCIVSNFIEHIAGYMDIGFNPFSNVERGDGGKEDNKGNKLREYDEVEQEEEMGKSGKRKSSEEEEGKDQLQGEEEEGEIGRIREKYQEEEMNTETVDII